MCVRRLRRHSGERLGLAAVGPCPLLPLPSRGRGGRTTAPHELPDPRRIRARAASARPPPVCRRPARTCRRCDRSRRRTAPRPAALAGARASRHRRAERDASPGRSARRARLSVASWSSVGKRAPASPGAPPGPGHSLQSPWDARVAPVRGGGQGGPGWPRAAAPGPSPCRRGRRPGAGRRAGRVGCRRSWSAPRRRPSRRCQECRPAAARGWAGRRGGRPRAALARSRPPGRTPRNPTRPALAPAARRGGCLGPRRRVGRQPA